MGHVAILPYYTKEAPSVQPETEVNWKVDGKITSNLFILFNEAKQKWNPGREEPTFSLFMGKNVVLILGNTGISNTAGVR